jgi:alkylation response protein AidB-like acyl-CoA dehydrogenase
VEAALTAGSVLLAAEQLGVAEWCLETTVAYVKERHQFGRPVGSFQAVKHRLAQLWVQVTQARAVARYAAGCLAAGDPDTTVAAHLAQAHCGPLAVRAAEECVQLHGGIGFTWEHPAHLYLKRAKTDAIALGTAAHHRASLARLQDLQPTAA